MTNFLHTDTIQFEGLYCTGRGGGPGLSIFYIEFGLSYLTEKNTQSPPLPRAKKIM